MEETFDWNSGIWNLHTSPKIKMFLWKIFRGALPVGECLEIRNITSALSCKRCNTTKSINLLFLHCELAQKVWKIAQFSHCIDTSGLVDLAGSWNALCKETCLPPTDICSGQLAPWILWFLWLARNDYVFNNKEATPEMIITKAVVAVREWLAEQSPHKGPPHDNIAAPSNHPTNRCNSSSN